MVLATFHKNKHFGYNNSLSGRFKWGPAQISHLAGRTGPTTLHTTTPSGPSYNGGTVARQR